MHIMSIYLCIYIYIYIYVFTYTSYFRTPPDVAVICPSQITVLEMGIPQIISKLFD